MHDEQESINYDKRASIEARDLLRAFERASGRAVTMGTWDAVLEVIFVGMTNDARPWFIEAAKQKLGTLMSGWREPSDPIEFTEARAVVLTAVVKRIQAVDPSFARALVSFLVGEVWQRAPGAESQFNLEALS